MSTALVVLRGGPGHGQHVEVNVFPVGGRRTHNIVHVVIAPDGAAHSLDTVPNEVMRVVRRTDVHAYRRERDTAPACVYDDEPTS